MLEYLQRLEIAIELDRQRRLAAKLKSQAKSEKAQRDSQYYTKRG